VDNTVLVVATVVALVIAFTATVTALRAGRRASRAAERVAQLLEPDVVVADVAAGPAIVADAGADPVFPSGAAVRALPTLDTLPELRARTEPDAPVAVPTIPAHAIPAHAIPAVDVVSERADPTQVRIPVFDLDRLRAWLTDGNVNLGRIAVVSVELDNLNHVNERLGHRSGAHLLEAITQRLRAVTRPRDVVAHVNPERFILVCRDVPDRAAAEALSERIAMGVAHPSVLVAGVAEVTASIGVALAADAHERPESVLRRAIKAGTRARGQGGARIEICEDAPTATIGDVEFAAALTNGEFVVHYLPIVSCTTGRVAGFESLIRWDHPERGLLLPGEFLPQAERNGAIVAIGTWAIEHACRQMASWHAGGGTSFKLNLNLSAREFSEPTLPAQVKRVLGETGLQAGAVWLEITEETLVRDRDAAERALQQLHEIGVRLVIDDFGAGGSSLVSLKHFPLDAIKIDRAFVADLGKNRDSDAICSAILELAHSLGLGAIAEGVETLEQWVALRAMGCELGQGRLFGPARPASDYGDHPAATTGLQPAPDTV
jgi:diguanylate cyclase (GGDEF)-like protein